MTGSNESSREVTTTGIRKRGSFWWRLHQLAGLQFSLFLSFVLLSGTFAVLSHEIDWLLRPAMWVQPVAVEERVSWGNVLDAVYELNPEFTVLNMYQPIHSAATFDVVVSDENEMMHVYIHPRTGEVTGLGAWAGVQRFLRDAHRRIMIFQSFNGVRVGIMLVCLSAIYLLVSLISSFWIYKKWWKGFIRLPKGKGLRAYMGDLHRWMGIWSLWFVIVITYTGLWYLVQEFTERPDFSLDAIERSVVTQPGNSPTTIGAALDLAVAESLLQQPSFKIERVFVAATEFQLLGQTDRALVVDDYANAMLADTSTGELISARDPSTFTLRQRLSATNNRLHFGTFGGYISKWVYFIFGLLLSGLSITGVSVYVLRMIKDRKASVGWSIFIKTAWSGMGAARWPALALTLISFLAAPFLL